MTFREQFSSDKAYQQYLRDEKKIIAQRNMEASNRTKADVDTLRKNGKIIILKKEQHFHTRCSGLIAAITHGKGWLTKVAFNQDFFKRGVLIAQLMSSLRREQCFTSGYSC